MSQTSRTRAAGRDAAPLDRLVYQDGDISKLPVVPHDLGMTRLQHADSDLLLGRVPGNVTQKDFIRRGASLRPLSIVERALRVKPQGQRELRRSRNRFNHHTYDAAEQLDRQVRRIQQETARAGGAAGQGEQGDAREAFPESGTSPPRHPETVPESEAVRGSATAAGASQVARSLSARSGAPLVVGPSPAHHFSAGGSSSQLRRERRRAVERQRIAEANLELRKQALVDRNLEVLQDIGHQHHVNRQLAQHFREVVSGRVPLAVPGGDAAFSNRAATPEAEPEPAPAAEGSGPSSAASTASTASTIVLVAAAGLVAVTLVVAAVAISKRQMHARRK